MTSEDEGFSRTEIPKLKDWMTFPEAARALGISKQMIHKMVFILDLFDVSEDVRKIGEKPIYVVRETAVLALKEERGEQHKAE